MPLVQTDYGLIYNDNGTLCATLRPGEGRFGGAVAVEEGTTNQIFVAGYNSWFANLNVGDSTDRSVGGGTIRVTRLGEHRYRAEVIADCTYPRLSLTNNFTWPANQPHTISAYILDYYEAPGTTGRLGLGRSNSGDSHLHGADGLGRKTHTHQDTGDINAGFAVRAGNHLIKAGTYIEWEFAQVELNKPFATSFVDGTRADGILRYPDVLSPLSSEGTVSFKWRSPAIIRWGSTQHDFPKVAQMGRYYRNGSLTLWLWDSNLRFMLYNDGWTSTSNLVSSVEPERWYDIAITWKNKVFRAFVDGEMVHETNRPNLPNEWADGGDFRIEKSSSAHPNALYDELLILPYAADEQEIQSWYQNGINHVRKPGYYASFDDSLALQYWSEVTYDYRVQSNRIIFTEAPKPEDHILAFYETYN